MTIVILHLDWTKTGVKENRPPQLWIKIRQLSASSRSPRPPLLSSPPHERACRALSPAGRPTACAPLSTVGLPTLGRAPRQTANPQGHLRSCGVPRPTPPPPSPYALVRSPPAPPMARSRIWMGRSRRSGIWKGQVSGLLCDFQLRGGSGVGGVLVVGPAATVQPSSTVPPEVLRWR